MAISLGLVECASYSLAGSEKTWGSPHAYELVTKNEAATYAWFESQKGLRSQLVLDDFAKAVDEILSGNSPVIYEHPYHAGKWEVIFGEPTTFSGGLPRIFHAVPIN